MKTFTEIIESTFNSKSYRIKKRVYVKPIYKRDDKGRFIGGLKRKGYWLILREKKKPKVSNMQLFAENLNMNNYILRILRAKKIT